MGSQRATVECQQVAIERYSIVFNLDTQLVSWDLTSSDRQRVCFKHTSPAFESAHDSFFANLIGEILNPSPISGLLR